MQTKEVLTEWSKNKEQVFMYRQYKHTRSSECVVVGFYTETGRMGRSKWDTKPDRMVVEIMDYSYTTPRVERVLARYLSTTSHKSITEYREYKERIEKAQSEKANTFQALKAEFEEISKELGMTIRIDVTSRNSTYGSLVCASGNLAILIATLRDAKKYYDSIVEEVVA